MPSPTYMTTLPPASNIEPLSSVRLVCLSTAISLQPIWSPSMVPTEHTAASSTTLQWRPMGSQITNLTIVFSTVYSGADQRKHQSSASLDFVRGIHPSQRANNAENVSIWWRHHHIDLSVSVIDLLGSCINIEVSFRNNQLFPIISFGKRFF